MEDKSEAIKRVGPVCRSFDLFSAAQAASDQLLNIDMIGCLLLLHWVSREVASIVTYVLVCCETVCTGLQLDIVVSKTHSYSYTKRSLKSLHSLFV